MLTITNLAVSYGAVPVLRSVTLALGSDEIVGVIGRNGVGKTTLMKAIMGLLPSRGGAIALSGEDLTSLPSYRRARRGIGYVPQGRMIFPNLTVEENLSLGADLNRDAGRQRIGQILDSFPRLSERLGQLGGTLSGGEQQMLALARALVGDPKILLLDEPTAGIQPSIVAEITEQLKRINQARGLSMILVEQNVEMIATVAQRIYIIDKGRVAAEIAPEQISDASIVRDYLAI